LLRHLQQPATESLHRPEYRVGIGDRTRCTERDPQGLTPTNLCASPADALLPRLAHFCARIPVRASFVFAMAMMSPYRSCRLAPHKRVGEYPTRDTAEA
jgi:hypothetical protein